MVAQPLEIHVDPESEIGQQLAQAKERPLRLVSNGRWYRVQPESGEEAADEPPPGHDLERAAAAWRATFGIWKGLDLETFKAELKEQRGQDTPGRPGE